MTVYVSDKPTIAVLPFANMSTDPEQEYFSDGITDDLITDLSKVSGLFVIARNSVFTYKGKNAKVQQIGKDLGVRYVLEGSVRRVGNNIRINAQLIDTTTGGHLWAERYDGSIVDVFKLQDRVTSTIVAALKVELTPREQAVTEDRGTNNIAAYDVFLRGWEHLLRKSPEDAVKAIALFEQALKLDPNYSRAYAALAQTYWDNSLDPKFNTLMGLDTGQVRHELLPLISLRGNIYKKRAATICRKPIRSMLGCYSASVDSTRPCGQRGEPSISVRTIRLHMTCSSKI